MRLKDVISASLLAIWSILWLALSFNAIQLGYVKYNTRFSGGTTYTREEQPVGYYTLISMFIACSLLGLFLTISNIRSAMRKARIREEESRNEANRRSERRERRHMSQPMSDKKKTRLFRRARERMRAVHRGQKDPRKND